MELIQISDPHAPVAFGIDFGTTNSLIAAVDKDNNVCIFKDERGEELLRSAVSYYDGAIEVGSKLDANAIYSIKRLLGKGPDDIKEIIDKIRFNYEISSHNGTVKIDLGDGKYLSPVKIAADIIKALCRRVENAKGYKVSKAVITVPAYFDDAARNAVKFAAQLAGIEVLRLINEPTAAALAYGVDKQNEGEIYAVYDLGGGTFDISILKLHKEKVFQVLAVGGDVCLGGDDFDALLVEYILGMYNHIKLNTAQKNRLITEVRAAKEFLSVHEKGVFSFNVDENSFKCEITKSEFEALISGLVDKTINITIDTIRDANLSIEDVKGIILVGGSTKVPLVQNTLTKVFPNKLLNDINPEKAVVVGAARQAHYLTSNSQNKGLLIDVLPLSLGIETMGGIVEKIIQRNTPLPVSETQEFTTYVDGQTAMTIHVLQGEREMVEQNKSLAKFELRGIPPLPAGRAKVKVEFKVDTDGILHVAAVESTTGIKQEVTVNSNFGLTQKEIEDIVTASVENFSDDIEKRSLAEAKINNKHFIEIIDAAMKNYEIKDHELQKALDYAKETLLESNLNEVNNAITRLKAETPKLLQKVTDKNLHSAIIDYQLKDTKK
ncbi:MAG: chaperone protein HscA [Candidatus Mesenet longicola]|uniref:Chaperone protein HscA n=1 Tax=Candidatus Mesenet longicola TaxID=1892558 RepID=A0A8J3MLS1_9RICK|nr:MAG: chaperone protein HscA [Candidatus Mesenet longicola]GHM59224.1 MAG: chaperone protein HscA [Candidatus Mesenet longicola]